MKKPRNIADYLSGPIEPWRLDLITRYTPSVARHAPRMEVSYPGHDIEPQMFQALYLAALTWKPDGAAGFHRWYRVKLRGQMTPVRRLRARRARGLKGTDSAGGNRPGPPIRLSSFEAGHVDERYCYTERHGD